MPPTSARGTQVRVANSVRCRDLSNRRVGDGMDHRRRQLRRAGHARCRGTSPAPAARLQCARRHRPRLKRLTPTPPRPRRSRPVAPLPFPVRPLLRGRVRPPSRSAGVAAAAAPRASGIRRPPQRHLGAGPGDHADADRNLGAAPAARTAADLDRLGARGSRPPGGASELLERLLKFGLDAELWLRTLRCRAQRARQRAGLAVALGQLHRGIVTMDDDPLDRGGAIALVAHDRGRQDHDGCQARRATSAPRPAQGRPDHHRRLPASAPTISCAPTHAARPAGARRRRCAGLRQALSDFSDKSLVLIDTAGMGLRDVRLAQQIGMLQTAPAIHNYLVLPASGHPAALGESVQAFAGVQLTGGILSKLDEAARIAGVLSLLYRTGPCRSRGSRTASACRRHRQCRAETLMATALDQQLDGAASPMTRCWSPGEGES